MDDITIEQMAKVLEAKALEIRDIDSGEKPFLYASGNWGPGYVTIKNLVGRKGLIRFLARRVATKVAAQAPHLNFVAGNATGGMIPGWLISEHLEVLFRRTVPYVYVRESRKKGGQKELITGIADNPEIRKGDNALVVEELVNFAQTTCNSVRSLRDAGFAVTHAACILFYDNPHALRALEEHGVEMVYLFTMSQLLDVAEERQTHAAHVIGDYRAFLKDPLGWQERHGLEPVREGGTQ